MNSHPTNRVAIIGVGLIGGSFGMALKKRHLADEIIGVGRNPQRLQRAVELGAVDSWTTDLESGVRDADLVYIATPVGNELDFIQAVARMVKPGCVITDAGSTKGRICRGADGLGVSFVGGHPMAGSEAAGVDSAEPDLFVNATYVLTPTERTDPQALETVHGLAAGIGSRVVRMDPESHDRCVAVISHLPHLIASALASLAGDRSAGDSHLFELAAGSFRDMTRVAGSPPILWRDICLTNADAIRDAVEGFKRLLDAGVKAIETGDPDAVESWFASGKRVRDTVYPPTRPESP